MWSATDKCFLLKLGGLLPFREVQLADMNRKGLLWSSARSFSVMPKHRSCATGGQADAGPDDAIVLAKISLLRAFWSSILRELRLHTPTQLKFPHPSLFAKMGRF